MKRYFFRSIFLAALVLCIAIPTYAYAPFTPERGVINRVVYEDDYTMVVEIIDTSPIRTLSSTKDFTLKVYRYGTTTPLSGAYTEMKSGVYANSASGKTNGSGTITYTMVSGKQYGFNAKYGGSQNYPGAYSTSQYSTTSTTSGLNFYLKNQDRYTVLNSPLGTGYTITSYYGYRDLSSGLNLHKGLDLYKYGSNVSVNSMSSGTVEEVNFDRYMGNYVIVKHSDNVYVRYQHLDSTSVSEGDTLTTGQQIGIMGDSGDSSGVHLHISASSSSSFTTTFDPLYLMP